jgi:hypothetical protein
MVPTCIPARSEVFAKGNVINLPPPAAPKNHWILLELERKRRIWAARDAGRAARLEAIQNRKQASEQAKRFLLAEIERERIVSAAAGDTGPTWISCPRLPLPERLAA